MKQYELNVLGTNQDFKDEVKTSLVNKLSEVSTLAQQEMLARLIGGSVVEACSDKNEECECEDPENCDCAEELDEADARTEFENKIGALSKKYPDLASSFKEIPYDDVDSLRKMAKARKLWAAISKEDNDMVKAINLFLKS